MVFEQLRLFDDDFIIGEKSIGKYALLDTIPYNARGVGSVNLGYEIVKATYGLNDLGWRDPIPLNIDGSMPDKIYANVFYPMHLLNLVSFLKRNKIPILKKDRPNLKIIAGGQGISNLSSMDNIVDEIFKGEVDGDIIDENGFHRASVLNSKPLIKGKRAAIELTRGCKHKCAFCEYSWVGGGKYREKDIELVKEQIIQTLPRSNLLNFMSANIGNYSKLDELVDFSLAHGIKIQNSDVCIKDAKKADRIVKGSIKIGIESFNEATRQYVNKTMSDDTLFEFMKHAIIDNKVSSLHCMLIFGLPTENYEAWYPWVREIDKLRRATSQPIRIEFSITNFEPSRGTPLENAPRVDFREKEEFLKKWVSVLYETGFRKPGESGTITYANARGRFGRKENTYDMLMAIKSRSDIDDAFIYSLKKGVGRTVSDEEALQFLKFTLDK